MVLGGPFAVSALLPDLGFMPIVYIDGALAIAFLMVWTRRMNLLGKKLGLVCPRCGARLWGYHAKYHPVREDFVLRQGRCPACSAGLLDPTDLRPPVAAQAVSTARHVVGLVVLVGLMAWALSHACRVLV